MNSDLLVEELKELISGLQDTKVMYSNISTRKRVFELKGKISGFIYVKIRTKPPYHWGITKKTVDNIKTKGKPWCVILLYESTNKGFVISSNNFNEKTQSNRWPYAQGDYKISYGKSLIGIPEFKTAKKLFSILLKEISTNSIN
jgi:hypothetical protein